MFVQRLESRYDHDRGVGRLRDGSIVVRYVMWLDQAVCSEA